VYHIAEITHDAFNSFIKLTFACSHSIPYCGLLRNAHQVVVNILLFVASGSNSRSGEKVRFRLLFFKTFSQGTVSSVVPRSCAGRNMWLMAAGASSGLIKFVSKVLAYPSFFIIGDIGAGTTHSSTVGEV